MKISTLLPIALLAPGISLAGPPVKFPTCSQSIIVKAVPNGPGIFFDEKCEIAFVLPPVQGKLEIKGLAPNMNLGLCPSYEKLQKSYNTLNAQFAKLIEKMADSGGGQSGSDDQSIGGGTEIDGSTKPTDPAEIPPIDEKLLAELDKIQSLMDRTQNAMQPFKNDKKGVAVGKINYFTNWNELVAAYQQANPKIHFERLPLEAGRIVFGRKLGVEGEVEAGAVAHNIFGIQNTSAISADGTLSPNAGSVIMGDAITGQVVLNYAGACPFVKNGKMPEDLSSSEVDAYLAANFQYRYSLQSLRTYTASYNLASIFKHIQESHSRGGFFNSSTSTTTTVTSFSKDAFEFHADSHQATFEYDSTLVEEVKVQLVNRVLGEMSDLTGQALVPALTPPPPRGSVVAADELQKYPNVFAQIGAAGLRVLDSIFGNSNASASYIRLRDGVSTDRVTDKRMFSYSGSTVFSGAK